MYTIIIVQKGKSYDITEGTYKLSWNDSIDTLGVELNFSLIGNLPFTSFSKESSFKVDVGDKVKVINQSNQKELFTGIIVSKSTSKHDYNYSCLDYAFYLNTSNVLIQFNRLSVTECIKKLTDTFNIPIDTIATIPTIIDKIYTDNTVAEIIKDMIAQATQETGNEFRLEMEGGKLKITPYEKIEIRGNIRLAENLSPINLIEAVDSVNKSESITSMRNKITVTNDNRILSEAQDEESINHFGLLQTVVNVDDKDFSQARQIARTTLSELNRVDTTVTIEAIGDDTIKAGRIINLNSTFYRLEGDYLITSTSHTVDNNLHRVSLEIKEAPVLIKRESQRQEEARQQRPVTREQKRKSVVNNVFDEMIFEVM